jgi:hypothetical protein
VQFEEVAPCAPRSWRKTAPHRGLDTLTRLLGLGGRPQIYDDCGGESGAVGIRTMCASLSNGHTLSDGAMVMASHCHVSRLDSSTVVDYMVVRPRLLTLIRVRQGTSHEWNGRAC